MSRRVGLPSDMDRRENGTDQTVKAGDSPRAFRTIVERSALALLFFVPSREGAKVPGTSVPSEIKQER